MKALDVFEARDLNGERAWFFWHCLDAGIGTAIGPFRTSTDAEDGCRNLANYLRRATRS